MTKIEWTNETWNPIIGCSKISEGCKNCYAEKMANRLSSIALSKPDEESGFDISGIGAYSMVTNNGKWNGETRIVPNQLEKPLKRKKSTMYFVCSMGDLFHESVDFDWIDKVVDIINQCPQHIFQILTKRPKIMQRYFKELDNKIPKNVWLGVTAENQQRANKRIPILLQIPAKVHFVSVEPMLSAIDFKEVGAIKFQNWVKTGETQYELDWVISGGETGQNARPLFPDWVRSLRDQCQAGNITFFFKQWGEWTPISHLNKVDFELLQIGKYKASNIKEGALMCKVGKKKAGSLLDGKEYKQFPKFLIKVMKNSKINFQIEQNWGSGCKGWIYFEATENTPIEELKIIAINECKKDWERITSFPKLIGQHVPFRPTVSVFQYSNGKKVKNGIRFKTKWR